MPSRQRAGIAVAAVYWIALVGIYFYIPFGNPGYEYGGLRLILYTLPLSLVGQIVAGLVGMIAPSYIGEGVSFFVLVVLCGGANAYVVLRLFGYTPGLNGVRSVLAVGVLLAITVQTSADVRAKAAMDYHWPSNVPKTAFLVPHLSGGWFQHCEYEPVARANRCRIWNYGGLVLYDEEFVAYDAGPAVPSEQLKIVDRMSGPDRVTLKNGRTLIPKSREADIRRFLDSSRGTPGPGN